MRLFVYSPVSATELGDLQDQINELSHLRQLSESATAPLEAEVSKLNAGIVSAQKGIDAAVTENKRLDKELDSKQTEMAVQYQLLSGFLKSQEDWKLSKKNNWKEKPN